MNIRKAVFGYINNKVPVHSFILKNDSGMEVEILEFGAIVRSIKTPDKFGEIADITLGYDSLEEYQNDSCYFGATVGRVASRTSGTKISINDKSYTLAANTLPDFGNNHIHGGIKGFNKVLWNSEVISTKNEVGILLKYLSKDGEEGYPGNLNCTVKYTINNNNVLSVEYNASTDKTTLINLTHHSYFNLSGINSNNIYTHILKLNADSYFQTDSDLIPNGKLKNVADSPFDFRQQTEIGSRIKKTQHDKFTGFDLNYLIKTKDPLNFAAMVKENKSGRKMEIYTTQACIHLYTSNFLNDEIGKGGDKYCRHGAICLEPQGYSDAPKHKHFKSFELKPNQNYNQKIEYRFSIDK